MFAEQRFSFPLRWSVGILALVSMSACRPQRPQPKAKSESVKAAGGVQGSPKAEPAKQASQDMDGTKRKLGGIQKKTGNSLSAKQVEAIQTCDDLVQQICKDLGPKHLGCTLSQDKLPKIGDSKCQGLVSRYSALIADLQKRAAVKNDASREQMAKMSAPESEPGFGSKGAPVQVVEFLDFECSACARLSPVIQDLRKKTEKGGELEGKVAYTARMFPLEKLHPKAELAAKAALLAHTEGRYWEYHDHLFQDAQVAAELDSEGLVRSAQQIGLDAKAFAADLDSAKIKSRLQEHRNLGEEVVVLATPTVFINGKRVAVFEFQEQLEQALRQADAAP